MFDFDDIVTNSTGMPVSEQEELDASSQGGNMHGSHSQPSEMDPDDDGDDHATIGQGDRPLKALDKGNLTMKVVPASNARSDANKQRCPECGGEMEDGRCEECGYEDDGDEMTDNANPQGCNQYKSCGASSSSNKAAKASKLANSTPGRGGMNHLNASAEHRDAATAHHAEADAHAAKAMKARDAGNLKAARKHMDNAYASRSKATQHEEKMQTHTDAFMNHGAKTPKFVSHQGATVNRDQVTEFIVANCDCGSRTLQQAKAVLNGKSDDELLLIKGRVIREIVANGQGDGSLAANARAEGNFATETADGKTASREKAKTAEEDEDRDSSVDDDGETAKDAFTGNEHEGHYFGDKNDLTFGGSSESKEAHEASAHADRTKSKSAHMKAARAHKEAEDFHKEEGNDDAAAHHSSMAQSHFAKAGKSIRNSERQQPMTRDEWLRAAPPDIRETVVNAERQNNATKNQLRRQIVMIANNEGDPHKRRIIANRLKSIQTLGGLEELLSLITPTHNGVEQGPDTNSQEQEPLFVGSGPEMSINAAAGRSHDDDLLDLPTMNYGPSPIRNGKTVTSDN